jgi:hypothetical protein
VALTVVPSIGLPVLAGLFTQDRIEDARAAERIGDKMALVVELHDLRTVVFGELSASGIRSIAVRYGFTLDEFGDLLGEQLVPVDSARAETDAFLGSFRSYV